MHSILSETSSHYRSGCDACMQKRAFQEAKKLEQEQLRIRSTTPPTKRWQLAGNASIFATRISNIKTPKNDEYAHVKSRYLDYDTATTNTKKTSKNTIKTKKIIESKSVTRKRSRILAEKSTATLKANGIGRKAMQGVFYVKSS